MNILLIPPHGDVTLTTQAQANWLVYDIGRAFASRVLHPEMLRATANGYSRTLPHPNRDALQQMLRLRIAAELLARTDGLHQYLRAASAAFDGLSRTSAVRITLDDQDLTEGSTECSSDVVRVVNQDLPYAEDLARAITFSRSASRIRIRLDRDQQLPAVLALAQALDGRQPVEFVGAFSSKYRETLAQLPSCGKVAFCDNEEDAQYVTSPSGLMLLWNADPSQWRNRLGPWAGYVPLSALLEAKSLIASGCRVAVVGFCTLGELIVDPDGNVLSAKQLQDGAMELRQSGVRIVAEWWIGAPGIPRSSLDRSILDLERFAFFDWLAGFRVFTWPANRPGGIWAHVRVKVGKSPKSYDLARSRPFFAPETMTFDAVRDAIQELAKIVERKQPLSPGRVAGAYVHTMPTPLQGGDLVRLDPDCAVAQIAAGLNGRTGVTWYAVNLRTRSIVEIDQRLAPLLANLREPISPMALHGVPMGQRERVCLNLVTKGVLTEVQS